VNTGERKNNSNQGQNTTNGKINATTDNDQGHSASQDAEDGRLAQRISMRAELEEGTVRIKDAAKQEDEEESNRGAEGGALIERHRGRAPTRRRSRCLGRPLVRCGCGAQKLGCWLTANHIWLILRIRSTRASNPRGFSK
jgi:hypothetical protein